MAQIQKKFIGANQVDDTKTRLLNAGYLRSRNAADSGDVNLIRASATDVIEIPGILSMTTHKITNVVDPTAAQDVATKNYVDTSSVMITYGKENLTLDGTDITNQYKDLAEEVKPNSLDVVVDGVVQVEGVDYSLSTVSLVTRVTFLGDLATGGAAALIATDVLNVKYAY